MYYFEARVRIELDSDLVESMREAGAQDAQIIHDVCSEIEINLNAPLLHDSKLGIFDCEIRHINN